MRTSLLNDQHQQVMALLPWYLNQTLENNDLQRVKNHLENICLGSDLSLVLEKQEFSDYASKLPIWICGLIASDKRFDNEEWLSSAFGILEPDQRLIIGLTFFHGRSYQDIARMINCSENLVTSSMSNARKMLQAFTYNQEN